MIFRNQLVLCLLALCSVSWADNNGTTVNNSTVRVGGQTAAQNQKLDRGDSESGEYIVGECLKFTYTTPLPGYGKWYQYANITNSCSNLSYKVAAFCATDGGGGDKWIKDPLSPTQSVFDDSHGWACAHVAAIVDFKNSATYAVSYRTPGGKWIRIEPGETRKADWLGIRDPSTPVIEWDYNHHQGTCRMTSNKMMFTDDRDYSYKVLCWGE